MKREFRIRPVCERCEGRRAIWNYLRERFEPCPVCSSPQDPPQAKPLEPQQWREAA